MGNSLLDFVMALLRDPQAAARYAADPAGALADAHLSGVTIADVQNLIPAVSDSLAMATPDFGIAADSANVWTSGAAAIAFDAFDVPPVAPPDVPLADPVPADDASGFPDPASPESTPSVVESVLDQHPMDESADWDWADGGMQESHDVQVTDHPPADRPGFDLF